MNERLSREQVASVTSHHYGRYSEVLIEKTYSIVNNDESQTRKFTALQTEVQRLIGTTNHPAQLATMLMLQAGYRVPNATSSRF